MRMAPGVWRWSMSMRTARPRAPRSTRLRRASRRFANVLKADGLVRGDRVAVFLSQSLELPIAHLAAFRSGMISIPLFALFGEDALEFRLSNSGGQGHRYRRERLGEAQENPRPSSRAEERLRRSAIAAPAGTKAVLAVAARRHRRILRPSILRPTIRR